MDCDEDLSINIRLSVITIEETLRLFSLYTIIGYFHVGPTK
jgi:hypothetical protein